MSGTPLFLRTACAGPFANLAREELLMRGVREGECVLYLWQNRHTVVIGRNQDCWRECDVRRLEADGGTLARRLSGGGAVYHDLGNLNFSFLACKGDYDVERQLSVIAGACRLLGIRAALSGRNDLTVDGRKFSGNAFYASGGRCCHHGTLLLQCDLEKMGRYLNVSREKLESKGVPSVRARVVNLCELRPGLTVGQMCEALLQAFGAVYGTAARPFPEGRVPEEEVAARSAFFAADEWRYSRKRGTGFRLSRRFDWGEFQLEAVLREGRLYEVRAYSDAMDTALAAGLPRALEGCACAPQELAEKIRLLQADDQGALAALSDWLSEAVPKKKRAVKQSVSCKTDGY